MIPQSRIAALKWNTLALILLTAAIGLNRAQGQPEPPRRANIITVRVADTANLATRVAGAILDNQFPIINQGPGYFATGDKVPAIYPLAVRLSIRINGNTVTLTGAFESPLGGQLPILYQAGRPGKTAFTMSWNEMHKVAQSIGGDISYVKKS